MGGGYFASNGIVLHQGKGATTPNKTGFSCERIRMKPGLITTKTPRHQEEKFFIMFPITTTPEQLKPLNVCSSQFGNDTASSNPKVA